MRKYFVFASAALLMAGMAPAGADETQYKSALAAAEVANKEAGTLKNQWTTTSQALAAAKQAAAAGEYDKAVGLAKQAEALAKSSIAQAREQEEAWRAAVIR